MQSLELGKERVEALRQVLIKSAFSLLMLILAAPHFCLSQEKIERLKRLIDADRYDEAKQLLPLVRQEYPNHPSVLYANALFEQNAEKALQTYSIVVERHQDSEYADKALFKMAQFYYARGKYDQARRYFSLLTRLYPQSHMKDDAQYFFCQCYQAQGKLDSAKVFFKAFVENAPRSPYADLAIYDLESTRLAESGVVSAQIGDQLLPPSKYRYSIQLGAFGNKENARRVSEKLNKAGYSVEVVDKRQEGKKLYMVWLGKFETKALARNFAEKFHNKYDMDYKIVDRNER